MVPASPPLETQTISLNPEVLVLGGGIIAVSIAQFLARAGMHVTLVEKGERLGGKALELRTFYNRPDDAQKWIEEKALEIEKNPNIRLLTQAELKHVDGHFGQFQTRIATGDGKEERVSPSVIVVATGYASQRQDSHVLFSHKRVIGLSDMERRLAETSAPFLQWEGKPVETVAYLLDLSNEDLKIDSINALKQGLLLEERFGGQVAVLCRDVKVSADGMERLYRKAREKGVLFFKYEEPPRISLENGHIRVDVKDTAIIRKEERWPVSIRSDLLVIGEVMVPGPLTESLSKVLKIHLGNRGFFMEDNPQFLRIRSNRRGVFVAGGCRFPQEVSESLIEARAVAQEVLSFLAGGTYTYELAVAEVDPKKCALCYTCPRLCPHSAITVERYAERNVYAPPGRNEEAAWSAAKVSPVACYGCGICVAECPAKAITLRHLTDAQIYSQMGLTL